MTKQVKQFAKYFAKTFKYFQISPNLVTTAAFHPILQNRNKALFLKRVRMTVHVFAFWPSSCDEFRFKINGNVHIKEVLRVEEQSTALTRRSFPESRKPISKIIQNPTIGVIEYKNVLSWVGLPNGVKGLREISWSRFIIV